MSSNWLSRARRLEGEPGHRALCRRLGARGFDHRREIPARCRVEILQHDRVIDHHRLAGPPVGQAVGGPIEGVGRIDPHAHLACQGDGRPQAGETIQLLGPDIALQTQPRLGIGEVDRPPVAGLPPRDDRLDIQPRGGASPVRGQGQARIASRPAMRTQMKGKAVPAEIEPGAGADLMQAQRQAAPGRNLEEAAEEDGGAADLIGLGRMVEEASEQRLVFGEGSAEGGPELAVRASARRGQTGCKHRRLSASAPGNANPRKAGAAGCHARDRPPSPRGIGRRARRLRYLRRPCPWPRPRAASRARRNSRPGGGRRPPERHGRMFHLHDAAPIRGRFAA